jgi:hypothetical protein
MGRKERRDELCDRFPHCDGLLCQVTLQNAEPDDLNEPPVAGK